MGFKDKLLTKGVSKAAKFAEEKFVPAYKRGFGKKIKQAEESLGKSYTERQASKGEGKLKDPIGLMQGEKPGSYTRNELKEGLDDYRVRVSGRGINPRADKELEQKGSATRKQVARLIKDAPKGKRK